MPDDENQVSEENPITVSPHPFDSAQDLTEKPIEPAPKNIAPIK